MRSEKTFARADGSLPRFCLGLNLEPAEASRAPNGALVELTEAEAERLDQREMRYRRIEVTDAVVGRSSVRHDLRLHRARRASPPDPAAATRS